MVDKNAVAKAVKERLLALYGDRLAKVILYGSYARGDFHEESDIDFLVVLKDEEIRAGEEILNMSRVLAPLNLTYNIIISKHPTTVRQLTQSPFLFYQNIRKEGVEV
jgi:predicted nucleotidyltransferase